MSETTITQLPDPSGFSADPFTDVIRDGARKLIEQAVHAELAALMAAFSGERLEDGRARLVRHGHLPEREVMTGIGPVPVKVPRVRDRGATDDKITFTPSILPRYLRKAKSVEELLPWLYLKGVSTGDFSEALGALLGPNAKGLSAKTVTRLKADWWKDYEAWQKRDLGSRRVLDRAARGVRHDAGTTLLGPQDHERAERAAEIRAGQGQGSFAQHLAGRDKSRGERRLRFLRRNLRREMGKGGGQAGQGPGRAADLLRLSG